MAQAKAEIEAAHGVRVSVHPGDLSSTAAMDALAEAAADSDILVNNAGDIPAGALDIVSDAALRSGFDLKVFGYITLTRAFYRRMKGRGGVIVNIIGNSGENWDASYFAGSTGNAALMSFTKANRRRQPERRRARRRHQPRPGRHRAHGEDHEAQGH